MAPSSMHATYVACLPLADQPALLAMYKQYNANYNVDIAPSEANRLEGREALGAHSEEAGGFLAAGDQVAAQEDGVALLHHRAQLPVAHRQRVADHCRAHARRQHHLARRKGAQSDSTAVPG